MSRRLDLGIASYGNPDKLRATIESIQQQSRTDWHLYVIHNPSEGDDDARARDVITAAMVSDGRIHEVEMPENVGYAGAVNKLLELADTDYVAYCDNDVEILTPGWDEKFCELLDENPECGWVFPGAGHFGFHNGRYNECLWNAGYCWMLRMDASHDVVARENTEVGRSFDTDLGHHDEVDYMIRLRLAGWQIGCRPDVQVLHHETATHASDAVHKPGGRIHDGVVRWMNKWNRYFCGDQLEYSMTAYDPRALRYTDWHPDALYLERMTLAHFPDWNDNPEKIMVPGVGEMDITKVLKPSGEPHGPYKGRAI